MQRHFLPDLGRCHFVQGLDGDPAIFAAVFDEDESASRLECIGHATGHLQRVIALVVNIHQEDEVEGVVWQSGVGGGAQHRDHVGDASHQKVGAQK